MIIECLPFLEKQILNAQSQLKELGLNSQSSKIDKTYEKLKQYKKDLTRIEFKIIEKNSENEIRYFLKTKMYNNKNVLGKNNKGKLIIKKLFNKINKNKNYT